MWPKYFLWNLFMCEDEAAMFDWSESQNRHLPISKSTENSFVNHVSLQCSIIAEEGKWRSHPSTHRSGFQLQLTRGDEVALTWACNVFSHSACFHWPALCSFFFFFFFFLITTRWHDSISVGVCVALSVALGPIWKAGPALKCCNCGQSYFAKRSVGISGAPVC